MASKARKRLNKALRKREEDYKKAIKADEEARKDINHLSVMQDLGNFYDRLHGIKG